KHPFSFIESSFIFILVIISSSCKTVFLGPTKNFFKEISLATVALILEVEKDKVADVRIAMGSIAPTPLRLIKVEEFLKNKKINDELIEEAVKKVREEVKPIGDVRASAEYRRYISGILFKRAFNKLTNYPINKRETN
ncbi:unnamed protein product, partial [marine sediment metagenome]